MLSIVYDTYTYSKNIKEIKRMMKAIFRIVATEFQGGKGIGLEKTATLYPSLSIYLTLLFSLEHSVLSGNYFIICTLLLTTGL